MPAAGRAVGAPRRALVHVEAHIWPVDCGFHMRVWQLLDTLQALGYEVHLVSSQWRPGTRGYWTEAARQHLAERGIRLTLAPFGVGSLDFWLAAAINVLHKKIGGECFISPASKYYHRPQLEALWRQQLQAGPWHVVLVNYAHWHRLTRLARAAGIPTLMDMHDLMAEQYVSLWESLKGRRPSAERIARIHADELACMAGADTVLAINPAEKEQIQPQLQTRVANLPFCLPEPVVSSVKVAPADVLVVGSGTEHNRRGLRQFLATAWPAIRAAKPAATLVICGRVSEGLAPAPGVTAHLRVPDLSPYYQAASIVLLTTVSGSGIKIKTIEALAQGACLVAHQHSVHGIPFSAGQHGEVVADLGQAAPVILGLLDSPSRRHQYQVAAKALFREHFAARAGQARLAEIIGIAAA